MQIMNQKSLTSHDHTASNDLTNGIHLAALAHCFDILFPVCIQVTDRLQQFLIGDLFFFKNFTVTQSFEGAGIQNLVTAAGIGRKRNPADLVSLRR